MLYPKKIRVKKTERILKILILTSLLMGILLVFINRIMTPEIPWAALANAGIIYGWITVLYSLNRNVNIAAHVLIQTLAVSILTFYIDKRLGMKRMVY